MISKMQQDPFNIIVCGIGGQGNILASELLGSALVDRGYIVAMGETYGASQRGGSVMSHIRVTEKEELGVLIPKGEAHVIVGFEPLETLRMARQYGSKKTIAIFDDRVSYPVGVLGGEQVYPPLESITAEIRQRCQTALIVPAAELALRAGDGKAANIALMGALLALPELPIQKEDFARALEQRFKGAVLELNQKVFEMGAKALTSQLQERG